MAIITDNTLFFKTVTALKELGALPGLEFTKKAFEKQASPHLYGYTSPAVLFEHLRDMGLVTLVRKEDLSIVMDRWGDEQNITLAQYEALPMCVQDALDWKVSPRVRHWYKVDFLAIAQEVANRKKALMKDFDLLNSL